MLDLGRDNTMPSCIRCCSAAPNGEVVRFGSPRGEHDFFRCCTDEGCDLFPGIFDCLVGVMAKWMVARRVAVLLREVGQHGIENFGCNRGGGVVVQIDQAGERRRVESQRVVYELSASDGLAST